MAVWLVHDGTTIVNAVLADTQQIAEDVTGLDVIPASVDGVPWIGWILVNGEWVEPPPPEPAPAPEE